MVSDLIAAQLRAHAAALRQSFFVPPSWLTSLAVSSADAVAEAAADRKKRHAAAEQRHAVAVADWEALRARIPDGPTAAVLLELLDLHKPYLSEFSWDGSDCDHCCDGGYDGESTPWPCLTYEILAEGLSSDAPD